MLKWEISALRKTLAFSFKFIYTLAITGHVVARYFIWPVLDDILAPGDL